MIVNGQTNPEDCRHDADERIENPIRSGGLKEEGDARDQRKESPSQFPPPTDQQADEKKTVQSVQGYDAPRGHGRSAAEPLRKVVDEERSPEEKQYGRPETRAPTNGQDPERSPFVISHSRRFLDRSTSSTSSSSTHE
jgi:hypothetical protein